MPETARDTTEHDVPADERSFQLAETARQAQSADIGLAAIAPPPDENMRPGTVIAAASINGQKATQTFVLFSDRTRMRNYSVISALDFLRKTLSAG